MATASSLQDSSSSWKVILLLTLGFWLSSILMLDGIVMPALYTSGMMTEPNFAIAGYSLKITAAGLLLWLYNRKTNPVTMMG